MRSHPRCFVFLLLATSVLMLSTSRASRAVEPEKALLSFSPAKGESHQVDVHHKVERIGDDNEAAKSCETSKWA